MAYVLINSCLHLKARGALQEAPATAAQGPPHKACGAHRQQCSGVCAVAVVPAGRQPHLAGRRQQDAADAFTSKGGLRLGLQGHGLHWQHAWRHRVRVCPLCPVNAASKARTFDVRGLSLRYLMASECAPKHGDVFTLHETVWNQCKQLALKISAWLRWSCWQQGPDTACLNSVFDVRLGGLMQTFLMDVLKGLPCAGLWMAWRARRQATGCSAAQPGRQLHALFQG